MSGIARPPVGQVSRPRRNLSTPRTAAVRASLKLPAFFSLLTMRRRDDCRVPRTNKARDTLGSKVRLFIEFQCQFAGGFTRPQSRARVGFRRVLLAAPRTERRPAQRAQQDMVSILKHGWTVKIF